MKKYKTTLFIVWLLGAFAGVIYLSAVFPGIARFVWGASLILGVGYCAYHIIDMLKG